MDVTRAPRIAFYSHDTMGLGHVRRNMLLASEVLKSIPNAEVLLIGGVSEFGNYNLPKGADVITLPGYFKNAAGDYSPRSLGHNTRRLTALRSQVIHAAMETFKPDIFIVDNVPRGAMSELDSILPVLAHKHTHLILGLRDIIDEPAAVQRQWDKLKNAETIRHYFSSLWVYGDRTFYDIAHAYNFDSELRKKVSFMGYLDAACRPRKRARPQEILSGIKQPYVLCMVGGGQDGYELATTFASATFPAGMMGVLITGSMMPAEEREQLQKIADVRRNLLVVRFVVEPLELMRQAECLVTMGGYNTTTEILSFHKRALIVPRVSPRQEQWIRAKRLAEMRLVSCIHPEELSLAALNQWLAEKNPPPDPRRSLDFSGLSTFTGNIKRLLQSRKKAADARQEALNAQ